MFVLEIITGVLPITLVCWFQTQLALTLFLTYRTVHC